MTEPKEKKQERPFCPYCDEEILSADSPFCQPCRVTLFCCPGCGRLVARGIRLCPYCGVEIKIQAGK